MGGREGIYTCERFFLNLYNIAIHLDEKAILVGQLWFVRTLFFVCIFSWVIINKKKLDKRLIFFYFIFNNSISINFVYEFK